VLLLHHQLFLVMVVMETLHFFLKVNVAWVASFFLVFLHFQEHTVHIFHLGNSLLVLVKICLFLLSIWLSTLWFLHQWSWIPSCLLDAVNSGRVYIIRHRGWIKLFKPVSKLFFLGKFKEVLESWPLFIWLFYGWLLLWTFIFDYWRCFNLARAIILLLLIYIVMLLLAATEGLVRSCFT